MSAAQAALLGARQANAVHVAYDPDLRQWVGLELAPLSGQPVWIVALRDPSRAVVERELGLHASAVDCWLLFDPMLGWRSGSGRSWTASVSDANGHAQDEAEALASSNPLLQLMVRRVDGRVTCPDQDVTIGSIAAGAA